MALNPVESDGERSALSELGYFDMLCSPHETHDCVLFG